MNKDILKGQWNRILRPMVNKPFPILTPKDFWWTEEDKRNYTSLHDNVDSENRKEVSEISELF